MKSFNQSNIINVWLRASYGDNILTFDTDMTLKQFNTFRRIILSEIAIIAIDLVQIIDNDTAMVDEVIVNRLGNIPVAISDQHSIIRKDLCECQSYCKKCSFMIQFPGKSFKEKSFLFTNDISPYLMKDIPVIPVLPGQRFSFNLICSKSLGLEHSKWSPGVVCSLKLKGNILKITLDNTGTIDFSYLLTQTFNLMKERLDVNIKIN